MLAVLRRRGASPIHVLVRQLGTGRGLRQALERLESTGKVERAERGRYQVTEAVRRYDTRHSGDTIIGVVRKNNARWEVLPLVGKPLEALTLSSPPAQREGTLVRVQASSPSTFVNPQNLRAISQHKNTADHVIDTVCEAFGIPRKWGVRMDSIPRAVSQTDLVDRLDLRDLPFVTIDGADAKDFDDAVYATRTRAGKLRLLVAIADVAHYVRAGTRIDELALERSTSVYFPGRAVPMLPERLSNGICSLKPNVDRLTLVVDMVVETDGAMRLRRLSEAVIRSHARLTYTGVQEFLDGRGTDLSTKIRESLSLLSETFAVLQAQRKRRGGLDLDIPEAVVRLRDGEPVDVRPVRRNTAHGLIEEAMIAANVVAARFAQRGGGKPLYRVHERPEDQSLDELQALFALHGRRGAVHFNSWGQLNEVLAKLRQTVPNSMVWERFVLRAMKLARYDGQNIGHFGLALKNYVHFTSPIRRYPDLHVHRVVKHKLHSANSSPASEMPLERLGLHTSELEQRATKATRKVDAWLKCHLLRDRVGSVMEGTVSGIAGFGLFVDLDGYDIAGLLHMRELKDDFYDVEPMQIRGRSLGRRIAFGDRLRVVVQQVEPISGHIDLGFDGRVQKPRKDRARNRKTAA